MDAQSHCSVSPSSLSEALPSTVSLGVRPLSLPSDPSSGATSQISKIDQGRRKERKDVRAQGENYEHDTTIDMLPDGVLLEIFDICRETLWYIVFTGWKWHLLVHVCRRWRRIIFDSPRRLNIQIRCTHRTPVRKNPGIWLAFPVVIDYGYPWSSIMIVHNDEDNVIAALEHPDRVCDIKLAVTGSQLGKMATVMQEPFPVLTDLYIGSIDGNAPVLPADFLGGSAPCLRVIYLRGIPVPKLPALLLSASDLVTLKLRNIPSTGYISPEAMVASLAALPRLVTFTIEFRSATPRPDRLRPPPTTRALLPTLTSFEFKGASEYLEDLVTQIDSPQLNRIFIEYLNQLVDFQVARLSEFVDRSVGPKLTLVRHAHVTFFSDKVTFDIYRHANRPPWDLRHVRTIISCEGFDWQVSHIAQVLSHFSATLSNIVHLKLEDRIQGDRQLEGTDDVEWLHLLHQLSAVQMLHVSRTLARHVSLALEDITGEMVAEMLPSLDLIRVVGQPASFVEKFVAARKLSGRPVAVVYIEMEFD